MPEYQTLSDDQLEGAIRSLPRREPRAALRARVLTRASRPRRSSLLLRPGFAFALLAALLLADLAVMKRQDALLRPTPLAAAPTIAPADSDPELAAVLADTYGAANRWQLALSGPPPSGDSYLQLRRELSLRGKG